MGYPTLTEHYYSGEFLLREAPGTISRDVVTFDNTAGALDLLVPGGTVFAFEGPTTVAHASAGNTGNGTMTNIQTNLIAAELGTYTGTFLTPTTFSMQAPDGSALEPGATGTAYFDGISFLITVGGTAAVPGDSFTVTLAQGEPPVYAATEGNTGNFTASQLGALMSAAAKQGNYTVVLTASNKFNVIGPNGEQLEPGTVGTYYADQVGFLLSAGTTAYAAGDTWTLGVGLGSGNVQAYTGNAPAAGVIYNTGYVPAGGTLAMTAIMRQAEVIASGLQWINNPPAAAQETAIAQLRTLGIISR